MKTKESKKIKDNVKVSVYVKKWPFQTENEDIEPDERMYEIDDCGSEKVKGQKYYVWKLLEYAMMKEFGFDISDVGLKKSGSKWCCNSCEFSLSHTNNIVAVAVSNRPVGLDIEENNEDRFQKVAEKFLHKKEKYLKISSFCQLWTTKEALFKKSNRKNFLPNKINTLKCSTIHKWVLDGNKKYSLSVATDGDVDVKFHIFED